MESALSSSKGSGLGEVDNSTICVEAGANGKKRKPRIKYNDEDS